MNTKDKVLEKIFAEPVQKIEQSCKKMNNGEVLYDLG